ncbi:MAG: hypothetical protein SFW36_18065 [Leptolyngbyaceae cyanobacterium bins.59]|nr:hypothetical protein [Leptolyngbyaceae cyanobacterium bins.59]
MQKFAKDLPFDCTQNRVARWFRVHPSCVTLTQNPAPLLPQGEGEPDFG